MTMMTGLETRELELLDEEFLGLPPRFLREASAGYSEVEIIGDRAGSFLFLPDFGKIRRLVSVF